MKRMPLTLGNKPNVASHYPRNFWLYVLMSIALIYTTVVALFAMNTRRLFSENQSCQQATLRKLETQQLETATQVTVSTQALARRLGFDEHQFQSQLDAKSPESRLQQ